MPPIRLRAARPDDIDRLHAIWRAAVEATHDFLTPADLAAIDRLVREAYLPHAAFTVAVDAADRALGFIGMADTHIDALFVDPACHGRGIGRALVDSVDAQTVDVNEQNPGATGFYQRLGFTVVRRSPHDDAGRPYPILHLSRTAS